MTGDHKLDTIKDIPSTEEATAVIKNSPTRHINFFIRATIANQINSRYHTPLCIILIL